jgi:putative phage-type endonuclease
MKTPAQIQAINNKFKSYYNIDLDQVQQGSEMWLKVKLGVLSASNASKIVAKKDSETRLTYMSELVAQICTGESEELNSKYLDWGKDHEAAARSAYSFDSGFDIKELPFVFKDDSFRIGCSPDGTVNDKSGVEIKCPYNAANYVKFLCEDKIKTEYAWQVQFSMFVLDCEEYHFCQFHPNMKRKPLKINIIQKDDEKFKTLSDAVPQFISDMDKMLEKTGVKFGEQWS